MLRKIMSEVLQKRKKRWIYFANISAYVNCILAIGKLILGIYSFSIFMCLNALYNAGIVAIKYIVIKGHNEAMRLPDNANPNGYGRLEYRYYIQVGKIIIATSTVYVIYSIRLFIKGSNDEYSQIAAIVIAAVAFTEIGTSIYGILVTRAEKEPIINALKLSNLSSAMISIVLTQTAILSSKNNGDHSVANGIAGMLFGGGAVCIGVYMVIHMSRVLNGKNEKKMIQKICKYITKLNSKLEIEPISYRDLGPDSRELYVKVLYYISEEELEDVNQKIKEKINVSLRLEYNEYQLE